MAEPKRHMDVPKERVLESSPQKPSCTKLELLRMIPQQNPRQRWLKFKHPAIMCSPIFASAKISTCRRNTHQTT